MTRRPARDGRLEGVLAGRALGRLEPSCVGSIYRGTVSSGEPATLVVDGDGVELEALWWAVAGGPAPGVLLTHPFDGDARSVAPMAVALRDVGYHAVAVSMRGFGRSAGRDDCGLRQPDDLVAVLGWIRARREIDGERLGLYGRSQGGLVALLAAARVPHRVRAVVVWNAVTDIDRWRQQTEYPGIPEYIEAVCGVETRVRSPIDAVATIEAAVLLVHGATDTAFRPRRASCSPRRCRLGAATLSSCCSTDAAIGLVRRALHERSSAPLSFSGSTSDFDGHAQLASRLRLSPPGNNARRRTHPASGIAGSATPNSRASRRSEGDGICTTSARSHQGMPIDLCSSATPRRARAVAARRVARAGTRPGLPGRAGRSNLSCGWSRSWATASSATERTRAIRETGEAVDVPCRGEHHQDLLHAPGRRHGSGCGVLPGRHRAHGRVRVSVLE